MTDRVTVPDEVVSRDLGGETVILNLETGIYFSLDEVGSEIWKDIQAGASLTTCRDRLLGEFAVEPTVLSADILKFVEQLVTKGLAFVER